MYKKVVSLLLCGAMVTSLALSGCGQSSDKDADASAGAEGVASASADASGNAGGPGGNMMGPPPGGGGAKPDSYDAVVEYTSDTEIDGETYASSGKDENAIHIFQGANVSLSNITLDRTSEDSTGSDSSSFYGVGASILATEGTVKIENATITSDSAGGTGVFAYGDAVVYVADSTITTQKQTSGAIHAAGGGTLYAWNLVAETSGRSAAAIRSDRGGGTMVVDGGSYTSNGVGSPAIYCTADISVNNSTLTANGSEGICIEGLNTIRLYDCDLTSTMDDIDENDCTWAIIVYQSMSGDSQIGNGTFSMMGGSITNKNGGLFYTTNTDSTFYLKEVTIESVDDDFLLRVTGNNNQRGWGSSGKNGAQCNFTAEDQLLSGSIVYDSISTLDLYLTGASRWTGAFTDDESTAGGVSGDGYVNLYIASDSSWVVTEDTQLTNLYNEGSIVDAEGKTVSIVDEKGKTLVEGESSIKVTVASYSDKADFANASKATSFADYAVEKPF